MIRFNEKIVCPNCGKEPYWELEFPNQTLFYYAKVSRDKNVVSYDYDEYSNYLIIQIRCANTDCSHRIFINKVIEK